VSVVQIADAELRIDGVPRVLMCASLFPFRVPRHQWRDRIRAVAALGYHALDVYIPWNFHEVEPDVWDFSAERDIEHFLQLAREEGLYVVARPGPYICSEWDGGALPAWLTLRDGLRLRQNEPLFLAEVERWFARIIPLLARHEYDDGGPVILVQVENELDFFDCDDPHGYLSALEQSARRHGLRVPVVACAGQGDISRATGDVAGVVPAVNLYPSDDSAEVESLARYAEAALRARGLPLLVTETNRMHRTLKRLVGSGARLLGPYLQASGWNFEGGTAVNNWGDLLGFMTHDYDFGGVLDPSGAERPDAAEARRLCALIDALGPRLASAIPADVRPAVDGELRVPPVALDLRAGGQLLALTELGASAADLTIRTSGAQLAVRVPPATTLLLLAEMPLAVPGARLEAASAELVGLTESPEAAELVFVARGVSELALRVPGVEAIDSTGDVVAETGDLVRVTGSDGGCEIRTATATIRVVIQPAEPDPKPHVVDAVALTTVLASDPLEVDAGFVPSAHTTSPLTLEAAGIHRGSGRYRATLPAETLGLVLRDAADIVDVRWGARATAWTANGGGSMWVPAGQPASVGTDITVTTQVWGHSNFDDPRLPSLRLGSFRGISGALGVERRVPVTSGWMVTGSDGPMVGAAPAPKCDLGGWMSGRFPQELTYRRTLGASESGAAALYAADLAAVLTVAVNGNPLGSLTPLTRTLWLGDVRAGDELTVTTRRSWGEPVGPAELLLGREITGWDLHSQSTATLAADRRQTPLREHAFPLTLEPGARVWVTIPADAVDRDEDLPLRFHGSGLLVTALEGERGLGRVWVGGVQGATLRGGRGDLLLIPRGWGENGVDLVVEATGESAGVLTRIVVGGPIDLTGDE
jgi:beta-galactosidase